MTGDQRSPLHLHISHTTCFRHNVGAICDRPQRNKKALFGEVANSKQGCFIRLHIVGIRLEQQRNEVDQPANTEQTDSKQVQDTHASLALVELMRSQVTQEQA